MGRKKSLFSGGRHSVSSQITNTKNPSHNQNIDNSYEALKERESNRRLLPEVDLKGIVTFVNRGRQSAYNYDFTDLVDKFPHHERLIRQLLAGVPYTRNGSSLRATKDLYDVIFKFVEFLNDHRNLSNTPVSVVSDITFTVSRAYSTYLLSRFPNSSLNSTWYGAIRRLVTTLKENFSHLHEIGSVFEWPIGPSQTYTPWQGYAPQAIGELVAACQQDIAEVMRLHALCSAAKDGEIIQCTEWNLPNLMFYLREKLANQRERTLAEFIGRLIGNSTNAKKFLAQEGYTVRDIVDLYESSGEELAKVGRHPGKKPDGWNIENIMFWIRYLWYQSPQRYYNYSKHHISSYLKRIPAAIQFLESNGYPLSDITHLYEEKGAVLACGGRSPFGHRFNRKASEKESENNLRLILATLIQKYPSYPFDMSIEEAMSFLSQDRYYQQSNYELTLLEVRLLRAVAVTPALSFFGGTIAGINLIRAAMHFLPETLYPFILHVQINTGWNLESILALTDDIDSHVTADLLDPENYVVIQSIKTRGQKGRGKPVFHRCSRHKQYSTYRLLKYVESVVSQYKRCQSYRPGKVWQYAVRSSSRMKQLISYYGETSADTHYASRSMLRRHTFTHFKESAVNHSRIRTSYETLREQQGLTLAAISSDMDHANEETTSRHYASDSTSNSVKDVKIADYQEQFLEDLRHYDAKIAESLSLTKLRDAINQSHADAIRDEVLAEAAKALNTDEKTILHLISPEGQTYIAACRDSHNPTWYGHEEYIESGQRCNFFNKCGGCRQAVIFPEALPYIARHILNLESTRIESNQFEWLSNYGEEWDAWNGILSDWSNQEQVEAARQTAVRGEVLLPTLMRGAK
jgi:hypothetical protein